MQHNRTAWISFANFVMQDVLYMLPAGAGRVLLRELSAMDGAEREAKWYGKILSWNAEN